MADQIQSIVQEARQIGTEISSGELLAKDRRAFGPAEPTLPPK
ncbi:MAG: hypothetical protein R6U27_10200 [Desulfobacterales bacterium]